MLLRILCHSGVLGSIDAVNILGLVAGSLTTVSFVPQVIKTWRTRSAKDISWGMFLLFSSGVLLWVFYGIATGAFPVIVANVVIFALALTVIVLKFRFRQ
jgi:MtN3 and saliva related transmembrane protein